jgi:hypothetical protein
MPMKKESDAGHMLQELIQDTGIPAALHFDGARELQYGKWRNICNNFGIKMTKTEPYSPRQNRADVNIREAKKAMHRLMRHTNMPKSLWDYCAAYMADVTCLTAMDLYVLHSRMPHEMVTGNTVDISKYSEFIWYEPIYCYNDVPFPQSKRCITC